MENSGDMKTALAVMEFLESSSSDENDELEFFSVILESGKEKRPKIGNYLEVINAYNETEFKRNFRMSKDTCTMVIERFSQSEFSPRCDHGGLEPISAEIHVYSFLWFCGNKCCIRDVASRFGVGESTFTRVAERVIKFLNNIAPTVICFLSTDRDKEQLANEFEQLAEFPNVIGCIDGTFIPIRTPAHKIKSTYINRHDSTSLTLQGICDVNKKFLDVFTGTSSKIHDARVFSLSFIYKKLPEICGNGRWHILGDAAYPLRSYLLTPFRDYGNLLPEQQNYNFRLSATRVKIENTFGLLKQRFRQLIRTDFFSVQKTSDFIIAICVLHNLCIMHNDNWDELCDNNNDAGPSNSHNLDKLPSEYRLRKEGESKRNEICDYLSHLKC